MEVDILNAYFYLIIGELIIIVFIFLIKLILNKQEHKKIDKILQFLQKNKDNDTTNRFDECIKIINENKGGKLHE